MQEETLATELLRELKNSCKRWFIAFLVMVGVELLTIGGFMWYLTLPVEEYSIEQESDRNGVNIINQGEGDVRYDTTEGHIQAQSDESTQ